MFTVLHLEKKKKIVTKYVKRLHHNDNIKLLSLELKTKRLTIVNVGNKRVQLNNTIKDNHFIIHNI